MSPTDRLIRLKATVRQFYGGRFLYPGDAFPEPLPERTARALIRHHFAEEVTEQPRRTYKRRDMRAEKE